MRGNYYDWALGRLVMRLQLGHSYLINDHSLVYSAEHFVKKPSKHADGIH